MKIFLALCGLLCSSIGSAQINLRFVPLDSTFVKPLGFVAAHDGSDEIYILGKDGPVNRYDLVTHQKSLFLDLSDRLATESEGGLLSATFHPNTDSAYFYILYTVPCHNMGSKATTQLSRFTMDADGEIIEESEVVIFAINKPEHKQNGGGLAFGPDGYLYIGIGDGGGKYDIYDNGQNPMSLLGKVLRIDVDRQDVGKAYAIPPDNPFADVADTLAEIWSLGLRNPFGLSFDSETGDLYIGDKADSYWQEINFQPYGSGGGQNYGWNCMEGFERFSPSSTRFCGDDLTAYATPLLAYGRDNHHNVVGGSITAGLLYRGSETALYGKYVFGDFYANRIFVLDPTKPDIDSVETVVEDPIQNLTTLGTANDGSLYAVDYNGEIYLLELEEPTRVRNSAILSLNVFPNPTTTWCTIDWETSGGQRPITAFLFNAQGRVLRKWQKDGFSGSNQLSFDLNNLPSGLYTLHLRHASEVALARITVR